MVLESVLMIHLNLGKLPESGSFSGTEKKKKDLLGLTRNYENADD